jgi:hypothetical protein
VTWYCSGMYILLYKNANISNSCLVLYDYGNDDCYDAIVLAIFMASAGEVRRAFRPYVFFLKKISHVTLRSLLNTTCASYLHL